MSRYIYISIYLISKKIFIKIFIKQGYLMQGAWSNKEIYTKKKKKQQQQQQQKLTFFLLSCDLQYAHC